MSYTIVILLLHTLDTAYLNVTVRAHNIPVKIKTNVKFKNVIVLI